jgi:hypothetical protein
VESGLRYCLIIKERGSLRRENQQEGVGGTACELSQSEVLNLGPGQQSRPIRENWLMVSWLWKQESGNLKGDTFNTRA